MRKFLVYGSWTRKHSSALLAEWKRATERPVVLEVDVRLEQGDFPADSDVYVYEDFLTEKEAEEIDDAAVAFAEQWHHIREKDLSLIEGVSAGRIKRLDVFYKAVLLFKNLEVAQRALTADVEHVYLGEGVSLVRWAWMAVAEKRGLPVTLLRPDRTARGNLADLDAIESRPSRFRYHAQALSRLVRAFIGMAQPPFAGDEGHAASSPVRLVLATCEGRTTTLPWFDQLRACADFEVRPLHGVETPRVCFLREAALQRVRSRWRRHRARLRIQPVFTFRGIDVWPYWESEIEGMFWAGLADSHGEAQGRLAWLRAAKARALVASWHELSPFMYEVTRAAGIPLIVLQDSWLPGEHFPAGYRHFMCCDDLLVWGEISASWCRHIPGCTVHIAGNPRAPTLDIRHESRPHRVRPFTVLMTHQCWGPWTAFHSPLDTNDMWGATAEAARLCPGVRFLSKIHPLVDDPNHEWPGRSAEIQQWVHDQHLVNFAVLPLRSSMQEALCDADLVLTYYSLTAVEAMTKGIPVAMVNLTAKRDLFPELCEIGHAPAVRSVHDLVSLIETIQQGRYRPDEYMGDLRQLLDKAFAPEMNVVGIVRAIVEGGQR